MKNPKSSGAKMAYKSHTGAGWCWSLEKMRFHYPLERTRSYASLLPSRADGRQWERKKRKHDVCTLGNWTDPLQLRQTAGGGHWGHSALERPPQDCCK